MSGHSKWNNIKRKKEATDAAKAKIFTKSEEKSPSASKKAVLTRAAMQSCGT